jgi:hypothetical protein
MIAAKIANMQLGSEQGHRGGGNREVNDSPIGESLPPPVSQQEAADIMNVSKKAVERAKWK